MAAFVHSGLTALIGLERAGLASGESIFVGGAAGNVGSAVLQFARARGAKTFGTAGSPTGINWCGRLGADGAANYKTDDVAGRAAPWLWADSTSIGTPRATTISTRRWGCSRRGVGLS